MFFSIFSGFPVPFQCPERKILGNSELFIKSGSDINLTCVALQSPAPPSFIYWYKGGRVVNYSQRGGISVLTERQTKTSKLVIARAVASDSGNYTCSPSSSDSASVVVHVINGEQPAAMQHGNSSANGILINKHSFSLAYLATVPGGTNLIISLTSSSIGLVLKSVFLHR
nr:uncharacterized protein LOC115261200 [Aedes albopictus]